MTSLVLGQMEASIVGRLEEPVEEGSLNGRKFVHWSYYMLAASAVVQTTVSVALLVIGSTPLGVIGCVVSLTMLIGAYQLKELSIAYTLRKHLKLMAEKIDELENLVKVLRKINKNLSEIKNEFVKSLQQADKIIAKQKSEFDQTLLDYDKLLVKYKETQALSLRLKEMIDKSANHLGLSMKESQAINAALQKNTEEWAMRYKYLQQKNAKLAEEIKVATGVMTGLVREAQESENKLVFYERLTNELKAANVQLIMKQDELTRQISILSRISNNAFVNVDSLVKKELEIQELKEKVDKLNRAITELRADFSKGDYNERESDAFYGGEPRYRGTSAG